MIADDLKKMSLEYLANSKLGHEIQSMLEEFQKVQETIYRLMCSEDSGNLKKLKAGTALVFAVLNRAVQGKKPQNFTEQDWKEIADSVVYCAAYMEGRKYSECVFRTYADYIDISAAAVSSAVSADTVLQIQTLAEELRALSQKLEAEELKETRYIEECLWISLEAMIKLLAATVCMPAGPEITHFVEGLSSYAFEYGRLVLYQREQEILTLYLEHQEQVNGELQEKYDQYMQELQKQSEQFTKLLDLAFSPDFRDALKGSVELARQSGVEETEIVKTVEDIDSFFLD